MTTFVKGMQIEVFQRVLTVLLLLHIGFFIVMRETSRCLFLTVNKLMLFKHLTWSQDI